MHYVHDPNDPHSLSDDTVLSICEDRRGTLWVGTELGGLNRFNRQPKTFAVYTHDPDDPSSLSHDGVVGMAEDRRGRLWVGTTAGLNMYDRTTGTFVRYTEKDFFPSVWIHGLVADDAGSLWLSTNAGLSRLDPYYSRPTLRNFDASDGLQSNAFNTGAYFKSESGEIFFGGVNGFNAFYPEQIKTNTNSPPLVITAFKKLNRTVRTDITEPEEIELSYKDNFISFEFASLDFTAPEKNQYTYQLEGFDQNWVYAGTRRYQSYTNLKGGDYVFRVKGSNNDEVWNAEGLAVHIKVKPPVWEMWWFRIIAGLLLIGGLFVGYRLRIRNIEVRTRELEALVEERTYEIERRRQVAEGLREILVILNSDRSLKESLDYIVSQAALLTGTAKVIVFQRDEEGGISIVASNSEGQKDNLTGECLFVILSSARRRAAARSSE
ncbi:MAG: triple tyrosine motif-containing protein [Chloroflexota bacterium]